MRRKSAIASDHEAHAARIAWWASFFATLALIAILGMARSAQALTLPVVGSVETAAAPAPPSDEEPEDEAEAEASEDEEFEAEECEESEDEECEGDEAGPEAPDECVLSSAEATIFASANQDRIRLLVRYTTSSPSAVVVDYGLHGSKGSLYLGGDKKHFAKKGVLQLTRRLTDTQMAKVTAAKGFTVRLRALTAPPYCHPFFDRQLNVRRATPSGLAWSQSE